MPTKVIDVDSVELGDVLEEAPARLSKWAGIVRTLAETPGQFRQIMVDADSARAAQSGINKAGNQLQLQTRTRLREDGDGNTILYATVVAESEEAAPVKKKRRKPAS
jgi:hypothetical protein